jgi:hypothetical protein
MSGHQWEYGWAAAAFKASEGVTTTQGIIETPVRLVIIWTGGNVPAHNNAPPHDDMAHYLNTVGEQRWELASTISTNDRWQYFFKRPKDWAK